MTSMGLSRLAAFFSLAVLLTLAPIGRAQSDQSGSNQSWSSSSQQQSPDGNLNPTRTTQTHTEINGHTVDKTTVERLGPDGRYVLFSETEKESVHVNDQTVRNIERSFGRDADGNRTLIQETQEESRRLPGGEQSITRTDLHPDADGRLQVVRRELEDSKQPSAGVRVTSTTVLTPDASGNLSPAVQTEQRETRSGDGTVQSTKSTRLADGNGGWKLGEVRESTTKPEGSGASTTEQRILHPDSNGNLSLVERTVERQTQAAGEKHDTTETYSTNIPGQAGDDNLQLVQRSTTAQQTNSGGGQTSIRQVRQSNPADPGGDLQVTQEAIDIVRPASGGASETRTVLAPNSNGSLGQVWVDMGKTGNPAAIQVDTKPQTKPH